MCIKWIKNAFKYEKVPEEKENDENHDKKILSEQEINFKKWYLSEFKEELQPNCFKTLLETTS